jgi:hypothetical protein
VLPAQQAMKIEARNRSRIKRSRVEFGRPGISRCADFIGAFGVLSIKMTA